VLALYRKHTYDGAYAYSSTGKYGIGFIEDKIFIVPDCLFGIEEEFIHRFGFIFTYLGSSYFSRSTITEYYF